MKSYNSLVGVSRCNRGGFVVRMLVIFTVIVAILGLGGYFIWAGMASAVKKAPPEMADVVQERFVHEIVDRGSVDSEGSPEVMVEVESAGELKIKFIAPEGTSVQKGDVLVELNTATLLENVTKQQLEVNKSQAALVKAQSDLTTAELTLKEYEDGKFPESRQTILNKMFTAEEALRTAEENKRFNVRLLQRGYTTETEVEQNETAIRKAKLDYDAAVNELAVLDRYTFEKTVVQYKSSIETAKAEQKSAEENLRLDQERLEHLQKQLDLCTIRSPEAGQVVYFVDRWDDTVLKEGASVYSRQKLIKLPDVSKMQVKGVVNEANIRLVKPGQPATIRLEAFPDRIFQGSVDKVNEYPEPAWGSNNSMTKEYGTSIKIVDPPTEIKPGLTAKITITVRVIEDAVIIPIQSVFEHGGKTYALSYDDGVWDKIEVKTGPTNEKVVVIEEGLKQGQKVVLGAWQYRDMVDLPPIVKKEGENENGNGRKPPKGPKEDQENAPPPAVAETSA